jgi:opacity protein-like surface antigen
MAHSATPVDGWYTNLFGGYSYLTDNTYNFSYGLLRTKSSYNGGYNVGGRVGYQSHPLRYELEYTYINANAKNFQIDYLPQTGVNGYTSGNLFMANAYYDFPDMLPDLSPYLGLGIGYAYLQNILNSVGTFYNASANVFAYQGTAGITYNFAEHYAVNLAYRYVATDNSGGFGKIVQVQMANIGVVYHFDKGIYK